VNASPAPLLPALREDIRLLPDEAALAGSPRWLLHDPVKDAFYSVGFEAFQIIALWSPKMTAEALATLAGERHGRPVTAQEVTQVAGFLVQSRLVQVPPGGWRELDDAAAKAKHGLLAGAMHNYLFFKVPLVRPAAFLASTLPVVSGLARLPFLIFAGLVALTGVYLASRQWADFGGGLSRQMTLSGALLFTAVLFIMKIFHELGHAYVATAMGVRVRSMGIAMMLFAPMLYTDVTDAWRLPDRRKRMAIDLAGVATELVIAGIALFLWAFLPSGTARDVALVVATAAVVMTLAINLSPFMRFDGYYVLADLIGVKNLQPRAFALVRWKLREVLFGLGEPCPDDLRGRLRSFVMAYGIITMVYRLLLYIGIAILVYAMSFKVLGIILFLVEIAAFVAIPVWRELKVWWSFRRRILGRARGWAAVPVLATALLVLVTPWSRTIRVPSVLEPAEFQRLYPSAPGEVRKVHVTEGQSVRVGDLLIEIGSTRLEKEADVTQARLALVRDRIARRQGDARDKAATMSLEREAFSLTEKIDALNRQIASLSIRAGVSGRMAELDPLVKTGRILSREDEIGVIIAGDMAVIRGYVDQQDLWRIRPGNTAVFIPDDMTARTLPASLRSAALSASGAIDIPVLAENHGGRLRTQVAPAPHSPLVPLDAIHLVVLAPTDRAPIATPILRPLRGLALVDGAPQSLAAALWLRVLKVLVQESAP
jgi:putative peptide zinc metalloprotease protein